MEELAKGVTAFANGGGGLLVLGITTRLDGEEVLDTIARLTGPRSTSTRYAS